MDDITVIILIITCSVVGFLMGVAITYILCSIRAIKETERKNKKNGGRNMKMIILDDDQLNATKKLKVCVDHISVELKMKDDMKKSNPVIDYSMDRLVSTLENVVKSRTLYMRDKDTITEMYYTLKGFESISLLPESVSNMLDDMLRYITELNESTAEQFASEEAFVTDPTSEEHVDESDDYLEDDDFIDDVDSGKRKWSLARIGIIAGFGLGGYFLSKVIRKIASK